MPSGVKAPFQVADSIAKFFDRQIKPPKGGWHFNLSGGVTLERHSESDILSALKAWRQNNRTFVSDLDLERELWTYYCSREPSRCKPALSDASVQQSVTTGPVEVTKEMQGPPIWLFLNTLAAQWTPQLHDFFLSVCDNLSAILVCPICRSEWQRLCRNNSPRELSTRYAVCQWVNAVHNEVNGRLGKQVYPYSRMITEFGAPTA